MRSKAFPPVKIALLTFLLPAVLTACSVKTAAQKQLGPDCEYFAGLTLLKNGRENEARSKFNRCIKKGTYYCARRSLEELTTFGSVQEKNKASLLLLSTYNDSDALLIAASRLYESGEISKVIEITENLNLSEDKNQLVKLRLEALKKRKDPRFSSECRTWFTTRNISETHYKFYRDNLKAPENENEEDISPSDFALNFRIELYKRNYSWCINNVQKFIEYLKDGSLDTAGQFGSDIGKTLLYGDENYAENAYLLKNLAEEFSGSEIAFYFWFYSGRLYDKAGIYFTKTRESFSKAVEAAPDALLKDNALWYLLNSTLSFSVDSIIDTIENYSSQWSDPEYFEDFLQNLITSLLASGKWDSFYKLYTALDGKADDAVVAQAAYIYGRLCQEKLVDETPENIKAAFTRACNSGSSLYYKIMAAKALKVSNEEIQKLTGASYINPSFSVNEPLCHLLEGYVDFGFPELIYKEYNENYKNGVPVTTALKLSDFLQKCGNETNDYYTQSLRIAAKAYSNADRAFTKEELKYLFPEYYSSYVSEACKKYQLSESVMYALIRSESFFDADVTSSAGAVGLTQLMEPTADDISRRLKVPEYSLLDAKTNIDFGTYYLAELVRRCDGSYLQAFFSYNAGISRVRRWLQSSLIEFGKKQNMPIDLFLETVPYSETREYGRKLISASVMYNFLYSNDFFNVFLYL